MITKRTLGVLTLFLATSSAVVGFARPSISQDASSSLTIVVIAGEDAVNIIQQKTAIAPIVEVRDRNDQPVAGAVVTFAIRRGRATFGGVRTLAVTTDLAGRAVATGLTPTASGALEIRAAAAFHGQTAAAVTIAQTNVMTAAQAAALSGSGAGAGASTAGGSGLSGPMVAAAAGLGAGILVAVRAAGGDESAAPTTASPPTTSVNPALLAAAGSYTLVQINGSPLPGLTVASPPNPCPGFTDSGTLTLTVSPELYDLNERSHLQCAIGVGDQFNSHNNGTWSLQGVTITFTPGSASQFGVGPGTISGSTLSFPFDAPHANTGNPALRVNSTWIK